MDLFSYLWGSGVLFFHSFLSGLFCSPGVTHKAFLNTKIDGLGDATNRDHESGHVQQTFLGALYVPSHALALSVSALLTFDKHPTLGEAAHSRYNFLECSLISVPASGPGGSCSR